MLDDRGGAYDPAVLVTGPPITPGLPIRPLPRPMASWIRSYVSTARRGCARPARENQSRGRSIIATTSLGTIAVLRPTPMPFVPPPRSPGLLIQQLPSEGAAETGQSVLEPHRQPSRRAHDAPTNPAQNACAGARQIAIGA